MVRPKRPYFARVTIECILTKLVNKVLRPDVVSREGSSRSQAENCKAKELSVAGIFHPQHCRLMMVDCAKVIDFPSVKHVEVEHANRLALGGIGTR